MLSDQAAELRRLAEHARRELSFSPDDLRLLNPEQASALAAALESLERLSGLEERAVRRTKIRVPKPLTPTQRRLIETAADGEKAEDPLYQHTVLCQTCLPYRDPGDDVRLWHREQGEVSLRIEAGAAQHPEEGWVELGLPFGPKPRLLLMHLNAEAMRQRSPEIEVEGSLTAFVRRLKLDPAGRNINTIKDQLARLSASLIRLGTVKDGRAVTIKRDIISEFDLWFAKDDRQRVLWPSTVRLSTDYFESLTKYAVPLDEAAIRALAHSAMALDIYTWLAQRLHRIDPGKPAFVPWTALKEQFGPDYDRIRAFRAVFLRTLAQVKAVYPAARMGERIEHGQPKGLELEVSPPPVAKRLISL